MSHRSTRGTESARRVTRAWTRIDAWLEAHAPAIARGLPAGASEAALAKAEAALGEPLPAELRALLALHDGAPRAFGEHDLLRAAEVPATHRRLQRLFGKRRDTSTRSSKTSAVRPGWWRAGWLPFVETAGGDLYCIDLDPGPKGRVGQIVLFDHEDSERNVVARGLASWLEAIARDLEDGLYGFDAKHGFTPPLRGLGFGLSDLEGRSDLAIVRRKAPEFTVPRAKRLLVQTLESVAPFRFVRGEGPRIEVRAGRQVLARWSLSRSQVGREPSRIRVDEEVEGPGGFTVRVSGAAGWPCFVTYQTYGTRPARPLDDDTLIERLDPLVERVDKARGLPERIDALRRIVQSAEEWRSLGPNARIAAGLFSRALDDTRKAPPAARRELFDLTLQLAKAAPLGQYELVQMAARALNLYFDTHERAQLDAFASSILPLIRMDGIAKLLNGSILLFNLGCAFAHARDRDRMLHYVDLALANGKRPAEFRDELKDPESELRSFPAALPALLERLERAEKGRQRARAKR